MTDLPTTLKDLSDQQLLAEEASLLKAREELERQLTDLTLNLNELRDEAGRRNVERLGLKADDLIWLSSGIVGRFSHAFVPGHDVQTRLTQVYLYVHTQLKNGVWSKRTMTVSDGWSKVACSGSPFY